MRLRYEQLFNIGITAAYYVDAMSHEDFVVEPTQYCKRQMSRYKILSKKTPDGIALLYECSPFTNDATAFKPITTEEKFTFKVSVTNPDFWYYADVNSWQKDKIFFLKNAAYNAPGNLTILSGALNNPVLYRPMEFMYEVLLENVQNILEVRDGSGSLIKTIVVRAKTASEPVGKKETFFINLKNYADGLYTLRHKSTGGDTDERVYCSADYTTGTLSIIEITYKGGIAWTGVSPFQKYLISISSRSTDWFIDVYIRKKTLAVVLASQLSVKHFPDVAEPLKTFSTVGLPDDLKGYVQFKSDVKLLYSQKPMHLCLQKSGMPNPVTVLDPLPLPSSLTFKKDLLNNLVTKIIVNV